jgi:hypothetical protein
MTTVVVPNSASVEKTDSADLTACCVVIPRSPYLYDTPPR